MKKMSVVLIIAWIVLAVLNAIVGNFTIAMLEFLLALHNFNDYLRLKQKEAD